MLLSRIPANHAASPPQRARALGMQQTLPQAGSRAPGSLPSQIHATVPQPATGSIEHPALRTALASPRAKRALRGEALKREQTQFAVVFQPEVDLPNRACKRHARKARGLSIDDTIVGDLMINLTVEMVKKIHDYLIETEGGESGVRDIGTLEYLVNNINCEEDLFRKAAWALMLADWHPFWDGQKRTALQLADLILRDGGYHIHAED